MEPTLFFFSFSFLYATIRTSTGRNTPTMKSAITVADLVAASTGPASPPPLFPSSHPHAKTNQPETPRVTSSELAGAHLSHTSPPGRVHGPMKTYSPKESSDGVGGGCSDPHVDTCAIVPTCTLCMHSVLDLPWLHVATYHISLVGLGATQLIEPGQVIQDM
jgi:hypothetical protein